LIVAGIILTFAPSAPVLASGEAGRVMAKGILIAAMNFSGYPQGEFPRCFRHERSERLPRSQLSRRRALDPARSQKRKISVIALLTFRRCRRLAQYALSRGWRRHNGTPWISG
jgi:hypothetical protein